MGSFVDTSFRAPKSLLARRLQPIPRLDLLHQLLINERPDGLDERGLDQLVLMRACRRAFFRQPSGIDHVLDQLRIASIGPADSVIESLRARSMLVGKMAPLRGIALVLEKEEIA